MNVRLVAGRYRLEHELGRGGMGTVWLGEDQLAGRKVAVKELRPPQGLAGTEQETFTKRALQEARSSARIQHSNAVTLFDVIPASSDDEAVYLIMEYIHGRTLAQVISDHGALGDENVQAVGLQLLSVLETAHDMGIVHRDIKPANIMLTVSGQVKLTDFGIAYSLGETRLTRSGVIGTQAYMAPELFESAPISPAVDLWSLGATLYYAVEGRGPFDRDTTAATLHAILVDDLPVPSCAPDLAAVIGGLLTRTPAQRFSVAQARAVLTSGPQAEVLTTTDHENPVSVAAPVIRPQHLNSASTTTHSPSPPDPPGGPDTSATPTWRERNGGTSAQLSPPSDGRGSEATSSFGPSATALQREQEAVPPPKVDDAPSSPPKSRLGTQRMVAAALLGLGTILGLAAMFLPEYGATALASDARWLWPQLLYVASWAGVTAWMLVPKASPRAAALAGLGLGVPALGLALQEAAEITVFLRSPGSGFAVSLVGLLAGTAGAICALAIRDPEVREGSPILSPAAAAWRKVLPPALALAAVIWYSVLPWRQGIQSVFQTLGVSPWEAIGAVIPVVALAAITAVGARFRTARAGAALLAGAAVYLLATALQDLVTVLRYPGGEPLTLFYWLYFVLVVAIISWCGWLLASHHERIKELST